MESVNLPVEPESPGPMQPKPTGGFYKSQLALRVLVVSSATVQFVIDLYHYLLPSSQGIPFWALWMLPLLWISFAMGPIAVVWLVAEAIAVYKARSRKLPLIGDTCLVAIWLFVWSGHV